MSHRISPEIMETVFQNALSSDLISTDDTAIIFYDLSKIKSRLTELKESFPEQTIHTIAIKANPLIKILKIATDIGFGLEAASFPELQIAEYLNVDHKNIVFDSPVKTIAELKTALELGIHINIDNFSELKRIQELLPQTSTQSTFGIRINPQIGGGKILSTSLGGYYSKFGIPLMQYEDSIADIYNKNSWIRGVHLHVGSQGISPHILLKSISSVYLFIEKINSKRDEYCKINLFDIGGGLPVQYSDHDDCINMKTYAKHIKQSCPNLFTESYTIITEFGRYISANSGWVASRVEYVKDDGYAKTLTTHVGADMFLRKAYNPEDWHHDITVADSNGKIKSGDFHSYMIAGPLCFASDYIAKNILLPHVKEGDLLFIHDTGAYTLSMWSRYNSRQIPKVIGYYNNGKDFLVIKNRERVEDVISFWK